MAAVRLRMSELISLMFSSALLSGASFIAVMRSMRSSVALIVSRFSRIVPLSASVASAMFFRMSRMFCPPCSVPIELASCWATCFTSFATSLMFFLMSSTLASSGTTLISSPSWSWGALVPGVRTTTDSPRSDAACLPSVPSLKSGTSLFTRTSMRAWPLCGEVGSVTRRIESIDPTGMPAIVTREWVASPEASSRYACTTYPLPPPYCRKIVA